MKIIQQRPDVRIAQAQLHSANARVGVAVAGMLPQFNITGANGAQTPFFDSFITRPSVSSVQGTGGHDHMKKTRGTVWLVDDDPSMRQALGRVLRADGLSTVSFEAMEPAIQAPCVQAPDVLIADIHLPGASGLELLRRVRTIHIRLPVIDMTAHSNLSNALLAYRAGAFGFRIDCIAAGDESLM